MKSQTLILTDLDDTRDFLAIYGTLYILTSDGHTGVVIGETKHFFDTVVDIEGTTLNLRFSKRTWSQYGTPTRTCQPLDEKDA